MHLAIELKACRGSAVIPQASNAAFKSPFPTPNLLLYDGSDVYACASTSLVAYLSFCSAHFLDG